MNAEQLRFYIIGPTLHILNIYNDSAVNLLLGTCAQESNCGMYIRQLGYKYDIGGAFGIYQMEIKTHDAVISWLRDNHNDKYKMLMSLRLPNSNIDVPMQLEGNLFYATALSRCLYLSISDPLPDKDDIEGLAQYWKKYYNRNGKGTVKDFIANYKRYISGEQK